MVFVRVSETYDLSTQRNKMALIGVHTPKIDLIRKTYPGLAMNTKFCRIVSQDVVIACASMEPADPLQVGTDGNTIAPEDLFNPILYKAVTNDSMSTIEARMHGLGYDDTDNVINGNQAEVNNSDVTTMDDDFPVYYSLLANRDGFKTANPQAGLEMRELRPLVFSMNYTGGNIAGSGSQAPLQESIITTETSGDDVALKAYYNSVKYFRGGAKPMPRFPTTYVTGASPSITQNTRGTHYQYNGMADGVPANTQIQMPDIPTIYTACIIVPPSRQHKLFYRMAIHTLVEFSEVRPIQDIASFYGLAVDYFPEVYHSDYREASKIMSSLNSQVDTKNADVKQVM